MIVRRFLMLGLLTMALMSTAQAGELRHNPFARAFDLSNSRGISAVANAISADMVLKAVLYDDVNPLVNIDGHIVGIGEQYGAYELREVTRDAAVFYKDGRAILVQLPGQEQENQLVAESDAY